MYPNLLHVMFFFQIFKQGFSLHFCLLNTWQISYSFLPPWSDHPKTLCWGKASWSSSLWNLLQCPDTSCMYVTNILLSTSSYYTLCLYPTLIIMSQVSQSLHFET